MFILAYRNNGMWSQLGHEIQETAKKMAEKRAMELKSVIFPAQTTEEEVREWARGMKGVLSQNVLLDETVAKALRETTGDCFMGLLNYNIRGHLRLSMGTEDSYREVLSRIGDLVKPHAWVIVGKSITDYNPLEGEQTKEAYVAKFLSFLPSGSKAIVCENAKDGSQKNLSGEFLGLGLQNSRVIVLCHHHAAPMCCYGPMYGQLGQGSLILETALDDMLFQASSLVELSDVLAEGVLDQFRKELIDLSAY